MKKQIVSMLLVLCMLITLAPAGVINIATAADDTVDAFGIAMNTELTDEEKKLANNPHGTDDWFSLFTINELFIARGHEDTRYWNTYEYDSGIGDPTSGKSLGSKSEGNDDGFQILDTAPFDMNGEGQDRYVAVLGYWRDKEYLQLFVSDKNGNRVTNAIQLGNSNSLEHLGEASGYNYTGVIAVSAGDFDGDGKDTIIAYLPEMDKASPSIREYSVSGKNITHIATVANPLDLMDNGWVFDERTNDGRVFRNTPVVHFATGDTDRDNVDELIISVGMNHAYDSSAIKGSRLYIYDKTKSKADSGIDTWHKTHYKDTYGNSYGINGGKALRWISSAIGNISMSGGTVDYPEIVTVGWVDEDASGDTDIGHDIGSIVTTCTGTKRDDFGVALGEYTSSPVNALTEDNGGVSEFTAGGHYAGDDVQNYVPVALFAAKGANYADYALIMDTVFEYKNGGWSKVYRDNYFNDDDDGINGYIITNGAVIDVAVGNFDNNNDGREQAVFVTMQKQSSVSNYFNKLYTYKMNEKEQWSSSSSGYSTYHKNRAYVSLSAIDVDNDSTIARIKSISKTFTDAEILAVLEATPYFAEVDGGDIGNSATSFGKSTSSGTTTATSDAVTANIIAGFEWSVDDLAAGFVCGAGFESNTEMSWTWEAAESQMTTYEVTYSNDTGENQILLYRRPVVSYEYEIKNSDSTMVLSQPGDFVTSMVSLDYYNEVADANGMEKIADGTVGTPGDPFTYRSNTVGLKDAVESKDTAQYCAAGTQTQTFTSDKENEESFTYESDVSFTAYGMVVGIKAGGGAGWRTTESTSTISGSGITKEGAVTGNTTEGYDFNWRFAHWVIDVNGSEVPVLGYVLTNVTAPPSPPENLRAETVTPDSVTLTWDAGQRAADEYRIYQTFENGRQYRVATVDGTENSYKIIQLQPNTTYEYTVRGYSAPDGANLMIFGESVDSTAVIFSTPPEGAETPKISAPSPKIMEAQKGGSASTTVDVSLPSADYTQVNYRWQKKSGSSTWTEISGADEKTLTLENITEEDEGTLYRCEVTTLYKGALLTYYSDTATISIGRTSVTADLAVEGCKSGTGTLSNPYTGKSNYLETSVKYTDVPVIVNRTVAASGDIPELTVYKDNADNYYGIGSIDLKNEYGDMESTSVYYKLTKSGDTYTVGDKIEKTVTSVYTSEGGNEVSTPEGFDAAVPLTIKIDNKEYNVMAKLTGSSHTPISVDTPGDGETAYTPVDTRLETVTGSELYLTADGKYYEYGANALGTEKRLTADEIAALYDVYFIGENGEYVFGRNETRTVSIEGEEVYADKYEDSSEYWYIIIDQSNTATSALHSSTSVYSVEGFDPSALEVVTAEENMQVESATYTPKDGDILTLKASVKSTGGTAARGAMVEFRMLNLATGAVDTVSATTNSSDIATTQWRADQSGIYAISVLVVSGNGYGTYQSAPKYYDAYGTYPQNSTEYRIVLTGGDDRTLAGNADYGEVITPKLESRVISKDGSAGEWKDISENIVYTIKSSDFAERTTAGEMPNAGTYVFSAYRGSVDENNLLATAALVINKIPVTIYPYWTDGTIPTSAADVSITASNSLAGSSEDLKKIISVSSAYFNIADKASASGRFAVSLAFMTGSKVEDFRKNFTATLQSESFILKARSASVTYSAGENGTVVGRYSENQYIMASGASQTEDTVLIFKADPSSGYTVNEWEINGTVVGGTEEKVSVSEDRLTLTITSFDLEKHCKDNALNVYVTFISDSHRVTYSAPNGGGTPTATADNNELVSGGNVSDKSTVTFIANPNVGMAVQKWVVDNVDYTWEGTKELYRENTLVVEDIRADVNVMVYYTSTSAHHVTTSFESETPDTIANIEITATDKATGKAVDLNAVADGSAVTFKVKTDSIVGVKEWQLDSGNGYETIVGSGGLDEITVYDITGDLKLKVIVTVAQNYTIVYKATIGNDEANSDIAKINATIRGTEIASGGAAAAYSPIDLVINLNENYYVTEWKNVTAWNGKTAYISALTSGTSVSAAIAEKPVVSVASDDGGTTTVDGVNLDSSESTVEIEESNTAHVDYLSAATINAKPDTGYYVSSITTSAGTDSTLFREDEEKYVPGELSVKAENISANTNVVVKYAKKPVVTYTSTDGHADVSAVYSDSVLASGGFVEKYSGKIVFTADPEDGYYVSEIKADGNILYQETLETYSPDQVEAELSGVTADVNITVTCAKKPIVSFPTQGNVTVSATQGEEQLTSGQHVEKYSPAIKFTATPEKGYETDVWTLNEQEVNAENVNVEATDDTTYTMASIVTADVTVEVSVKDIPQYTLTYSAEKIDNDGAHGTLKVEASRKELDVYSEELSTDSMFFRDSNLTVTPIPDDGYRVKSYTWTVGDKTETGNMLPADILNNLHNNVEISVRFVTVGSGVTFDPTDASHEGGYISAAVVGQTDVLANYDGLILTEGTELELTASPAAGYEVEGWYVDGTKESGTEQENSFVYTSQGEADATITVLFRQILYTLNIEAENASVTASNEENIVRGGETITFTAVPESGYEVIDWMVNDESKQTAGNTFTWTVPNGMAEEPPVDNYTIQAVASRGSYKVTYSDSTGGELTADEESGDYLSSGAQITVIATPDIGYHLDYWMVNGNRENAEGNSLTVTVNDVDVEISAVFAIDVFKVTYSTEGNSGSISASANGSSLRNGESVPYGSEVTFTVTPFDDDMVNVWKVNGTEDSSTGMTDEADAPLSYTVSNITSDINVNVELIARPVYTVTATAAANGSISIVGDDDEDGTITVKRGENVNLVATPAKYYAFDKWNINGSDNSELRASATLESIKKDTTAHATFNEAIRYDVTLAIENESETSGNSSVAVEADGKTVYPTAENSVSVLGGSTVTFTATPASNEMIASWSVNGEIVTNDNMEELGVTMTDRLSNKLVLNLTSKKDVKAVFTPYVGYTIPTGGDGYTISEVTRVPEETLPATEIRKGGAVTFTVTPDEGREISAITVNGVDCLTAPTEGAVTATANENGTYTVTVHDVNSEITANIIAQVKSYTVTISSGSNGTLSVMNGTTAVESGTELPVGTVLTITATANSGYTLNTLNVNDEAITSGAEYTLTGDITINATFKKQSSGGGGGGGGTVSHTVSFETNGGTEIESVKVVNNKTAEKPEDPEKEGYTFGGWYSDKELATAYDFETKVTKAITLYAKWNPKTVAPDNPSEWVNPFMDVKADDWYYGDVKYANENSLMNGTFKNMFEPDGFVTRAMLVTVLYRNEGEAEVTGKTTFCDVDENAYYAKAVVWGQQNGIINGYSETEFAPDDNITREQIAAIMHRYAEYKGVAPTGAWAIRLDYADLAEISDYATEGVMYCTLKGLMQGKGNNSFASQDNATRAETAAILHRFIEANK